MKTKEMLKKNESKLGKRKIKKPLAKSKIKRVADKTMVKSYSTMDKTLYKKKFTAPLKKKRKNEYNPLEEARLERIVFGDANDVINNLFTDEESSKLKEHEDVNNDDDVSADDVNSDADIDHESGSSKEKKKKPAWIDEDDVQCSVREATRTQNRKLPDDVPQKLYKDYLHDKYKQLIGTPKWAEFRKRDENADDLDEEILKHSCHLEKPKTRNLPESIIDIKALTPINKETRTEGPIITSVQFHPTSTVSLVAGTSGVLSLFQVDGIENKKLHSMEFKKFSINSAKFLKEGTEVLIGSKFHSHCHSYDLISGKTHRIPLPHGMTNLEKYEVSPDGKLLAVCGRLGDIFLLSSATKELIGRLKMNARCRGLCFTPDNKTLITHGDSSEMYIWDINNRICTHRAADDGCLSSASIAISPSGQFLATGSREGVVNLYETKIIVQERNPKPLKVSLNLITSITSLKFNSHSEILSIASSKKHNAFRMMHLPSFSIFSNFPTFQTNISMPEAVDFSPGSGFLSVSNRFGSAYLYRLKHYGNY